jgi:hypothetical protein
MARAKVFATASRSTAGCVTGRLLPQPAARKQMATTLAGVRADIPGSYV